MKRKKRKEKLRKNEKDFIEEPADIFPITGEIATNDKVDTTDKSGNANLIADAWGHGTGDKTGTSQTPPETDSAGGTTGGGGNEGSQIGEDGLTKVGDVDPDPEVADEIIDADTDGSQAGQVGHPGIDEDTA